MKAIVDAGEALLRQHGYDSVVSEPERLIRAARVTTGSFYTYFENCEAVMEVLRMQYLSEAIDVVERVMLEHHTDWKAAVRSLNAAYASFYRNPTVGQLLLNSHLSPLTQAKEREIDRGLALRFKDLLISYDKAFADVDQEKFDIAVELGGRLVQYAFRKDPKGSQSVLHELDVAVISYLSRYASDSPGLS